MTRLTLSLLAAAALAACAPVPGSAPARIPEPPATVSPSTMPAPVASPPAVATVADPAQMTSACRSEATRRLDTSSLTLSPAEETSLGFVVFGQAGEPGDAARQFECSFGRDGALRAFRAA